MMSKVFPIESYSQWKDRFVVDFKHRFVDVRVRDDPANADHFIAFGWDPMTRVQLFHTTGRRGEELGDFLDLVAKRTRRVPNVNVAVNLMEADYRPSGTAWVPSGGGDGSSPSPGDPNPKGITGLNTTYARNTDFGFTGWEYNGFSYDLNSLMYHLYAYDLTGTSSAPTIGFTVPGSSSGMTAYATPPGPTSTPLSGSGTYGEMFLVPSPPAQTNVLSSVTSLYTSISNVRALNVGQAQIRFCLRSTEFGGDAFVFSTVLSVTSSP